MHRAPLYRGLSKPINEQSLHEIKKNKASLNLQRLQLTLKQNRSIQLALKKTRNIIAERMDSIAEYIGTYRLKQQCPVDLGLISLLKFERQPPKAWTQMAKVTENQSSRAVYEEEDEKPVKKTGRKKNKNSQLDFAMLPSDPRKIDFMKVAKETGFTVPFDLYRAFCDYYRVKTPKRPFSQEEERTIIENCQKYSLCWEKVGQIIEQRPFEQIYYQFHNRLNPKISNGRWNNRQSLMLIILLEHIDSKRWSLIGQKMVIKSELQVRERYCNIVDPNLGKDNYWTEEMEATLMEIAASYSYCWNKISKIPIFGNKSDNCIWRKFRSLIIRKSKEEIMEIIPDTDNRGLAKRIIKFKEVYDSRTRKYPLHPTKEVFDPNSRARSLRQNLSLPMSSLVTLEQPSIKSLSSRRDSKSEQMQQEEVENNCYLDN